MNTYKNIGLFVSAWLSLIFITFWIGVRFHNNDDFDMVCMVKGIYPFTESTFLFYSSNILGWIYKILYTYVGLFEWYVLLYVAFVTFSFLYFFLFLLKKYTENRGYLILISLIFIHFLGIKILTEVSFTFASGLLTTVGFLIPGFDRNKRITTQNIGAAIPILLVFIGSLYRFNMMLLMFAIYFGVNTALLLIKYITNKFNIIEDSYRYYLNNIIFAVIPLLISITTQWISVSNYNEKERQFVDYQIQRSGILDDEIIQKSSNKHEIYRNSGWGNLEEKIFFNWISMDIKPHSLNELKKINTSADLSKRLNLDKISSTVKNIIADEIYTNSIVVLSIIIVSLILIFNLNRNNVIILCISTLLTISVIILLSYLYKTPPERIVTPIFIFMIFMNLALFKKVELIPRMQSNHGLTLFYIVIVGILLQNWRYTRRDQITHIKDVRLLDSELVKSNHKYFISIPDNYPSYYHDVGIWSEDEKSRPNIYHTGPFFNHPSNTGYRQLWQRNSFVDSIQKSRLVFYFSERNYNQMINVQTLLDSIIWKHYGIRTISEIDTLDDKGYLLYLGEKK